MHQRIKQHCHHNLAVIFSWTITQNDICVSSQSQCILILCGQVLSKFICSLNLHCSISLHQQNCPHRLRPSGQHVMDTSPLFLSQVISVFLVPDLLFGFAQTPHTECWNGFWGRIITGYVSLAHIRTWVHV